MFINSFNHGFALDLFILVSGVGRKFQLLYPDYSGYLKFPFMVNIISIRAG